MTKGRTVDLAYSLACLLLGGWVWIYAGTFPQLQGGYPGPSLFPRIIATCLVLCGLYLTAIAVMRRRGDLDEPAFAERISALGFLRVAAILGIIAAYPVIRATLGFIAAVGLLVFAVTISLRARFPYAVLTAIVASLTIYYLFTSLLRVPL